MQIILKGDKYWDGDNWTNIPKDTNGLYSVDWLKQVGVPIVDSQTITERQVSMDSKFIYTQKYRVDTMKGDTNMFKPIICMFYGETRGQRGFLTIAEEANCTLD